MASRRPRTVDVQLEPAPAAALGGGLVDGLAGLIADLWLAGAWSPPEPPTEAAPPTDRPAPRPRRRRRAGAPAPAATA